MPFPVERRFISTAEHTLGLTFPPDYVHKMLRENGGSVQTAECVWQLYPIFDTSDRTRLKRTCNDVLRETRSALQWPGFPRTALAIGTNGWGDQLILMPDENDSHVLGDEVYWWDHETDALTLVAARFSDLRVI